MHLALAFTRILFFILSILFMTTYMLSRPSGFTAINALYGIAIGGGLGLSLIGFDILFRRFNLRSFNVAIIGLFVGYLMGQALVLTFDALLTISATLTISTLLAEMIKIALFLFGLYLGTLMTIRSADELYISIPFVRFSSHAEKKKDIIVDISALDDPRIIDLAASGLVDHHLVIPQFVIKEIYSQIETGDELSKERGKHCQEALKKIEELPHVQLRYHDLDFPEVTDISQKLIRLARLLEANILSTTLSPAQLPTLDGIRLINLNTLSHALKPLSEAGEKMRIKIQRTGKEPRQGVGYLDDGTMVVVNGAGTYIGKTVDAQVLSVKHTTTGRIIFCNIVDGKGIEDEG